MTDNERLIGTIDFPIDRPRVLAAVDIVEITDTRNAPVRERTARRWKEEAPAHVRFAIHAPPAVLDGTAPDDEDELWRRTRRVAELLDATAIVIETPTEFVPTRNNRERIERFSAGPRDEGRWLVWAPRGPWVTEQAGALAADCGMVLAVDPLRDEPPTGDIAYFRLGPFAAMGSRIGVFELEQIAERIASFPRAVCVFQTQRALDDARNLKRLLEVEGTDPPR